MIQCEMAILAEPGLRLGLGCYMKHYSNNYDEEMNEMILRV